MHALEYRTSRVRRLRRGRSGGVLVEGLVVLSLLVVCFVAAIGAHEVVNRKLDTVYDARRQAWEQTASGCNQFPIDLGVLAERVALRDRNVIEGLTEGELRIGTYIDDTIAIALELLGGEDTRVAESQSDVHSPAVVPGLPGSVSTRTLMGCNEEPHDLGTRSSLYEWISGLFL